ncbi:ASKHA domain-containing protein [Oceanibacterium hippocampi]|uniref:Na(+)-translocating NADH-quinone reductase subunit F n=1 Tax=Oceanibacterium hippocampi TaxID=745714 RepID=A0A1Y5U032_9PROT|nr:ASKHA domain-containing protein [Oceanibacterium hippocampi]SLN77179.1 Na(+)-translocating NADH-quinone reductase subunit F [Oceanibacterium hippocampi]
MNETVRVVFTPSGRRGSFPVGTAVLDAARALGVDIDSVCGGRAICGRCQVAQPAGEFSKFQISATATSLTPAEEGEARCAARGKLAEGNRLSCQARLLGDAVIDVPPESQVHRQIVRKRVEMRAIENDPVTRLYYVEVREPDMHDPSGDLRRLFEALEREWGLVELEADIAVIRSLQTTLRTGKWAVTAAVRNSRELIALWPGFEDRLYGIAVDVGSTTISLQLCELLNGKVLAAEGAMNPQIRFGEDLMSRVSYVMMHPEGAAEMTAVVRRAIRDLATRAAEAAGVESDHIVELVIVGNPIMHHLVLGIDPQELGGAPFALAVDNAVTVMAGELDLAFHPGARAYFLPCIAGHVGADCAAAMLSESPHLADALTLMVDVGTNAEIVLGTRERILACSSPTGPAFEGAQISSGQRAAPGAIERVRIDRETLEPRYRVIGDERWSDEAGFAGNATGICGSGIIEVIAELFLSGVITRDGVIDGASAARNPDRVIADGRTFSYRLVTGSREILVTQNDVRAIQLGKAALYAGVKLLMDRLGVTAVERINLAGAFGSYIDPTYAMVLGLIPDCEIPHVSSAGNAAGTGARIALLNNASRTEIEQVVRRVEKIETAVEPRFQEHFVDAIALPHRRDPFPKLRAAIVVPEAVDPDDSTAEGGRRNRRRNRGRD